MSHAQRWWENPWLWIGGAAALSSFLIPSVRDEAIDFVTKGKRLSAGTWFDGDEASGFIVQAPEVLRQQASVKAGRDVPLHVYSLARMIRSEGAAEGLLRAHVAMNDLNKFAYADNLHELLTYSTDRSRRGKYGKQFSGSYLPVYPTKNARRYSTAKDPFEKDVKLAERALAERAQGIDRAQGATKFVDISSMGGVQAGTGSFAALDAKWKKDGYVAFSLPAYGSDVVLYRKG